MIDLEITEQIIENDISFVVQNLINNNVKRMMKYINKAPLYLRLNYILFRICHKKQDIVTTYISRVYGFYQRILHRIENETPHFAA